MRDRAGEVRGVDEALRSRAATGERRVVGLDVGRLSSASSRSSADRRRRSRLGAGVRRSASSARSASAAASLGLVLGLLDVFFGGHRVFDCFASDCSAGAGGLEPTTCGFGIRCSTN